MKCAVRTCPAVDSCPPEELGGIELDCECQMGSELLALRRWTFQKVGARFGECKLGLYV